MHEHIKHGLDAAAATAAFTSLASWFFGWLPIAMSLIASGMSITWLWMQMQDRAERKKKEREVDAANS